mmetsp:Transcript_35630/g.115509  ORF Transcript_35630/g.115509 Transcript_35630/m.115509 type:complete len:297 (+) Transcript_35630:1372-2262(+)
MLVLHLHQLRRLSSFGIQLSHYLHVHLLQGGLSNIRNCEVVPTLCRGYFGRACVDPLWHRIHNLALLFHGHIENLLLFLTVLHVHITLLLLLLLRTLFKTILCELVNLAQFFLLTLARLTLLHLHLLLPLVPLCLVHRYAAITVAGLSLRRQVFLQGPALLEEPLLHFLSHARQEGPPKLLAQHLVFVVRHLHLLSGHRANGRLRSRARRRCRCRRTAPGRGRGRSAGGSRVCDTRDALATNGKRGSGNLARPAGGHLRCCHVLPMDLDIASEALHIPAVAHPIFACINLTIGPGG